MRNTQQENFVSEYAWQELYLLTKHWKSDIEFYKDDLKILMKLIHKYSIWITKEENLKKVSEIDNSLHKLVKKCEDLAKSIDKHLEHIAILINDDPFKYDVQKFKSEHVELENKISKFIKKFRKNKKETFTITEYIVDDENLMRHLE